MVSRALPNALSNLACEGFGLPVRIGRLALVGGMGDAGQFSTVEPDQETIAAGVHNDIARAGVRMGVHATMASGTLDRAFHVRVIGRRLHCGSDSCAPRLNQRRQDIHRQQQPMAFGTVLNVNRGNGGVDKWLLTDRAVQAETRIRSNGRNHHAVVFLTGIEDRVAKIALEAFRVRLLRNRSATGRAVHWALPHSEQKRAFAEIE